jgi:hypothetical protein
LERAGIAAHRKAPRPKRTPGVRPTGTVDGPNGLWTVDFKGWWRVKDGKKCEPLTVRDAFSRYVLAIELVDTPSNEAVRAVFEKLFRDYGLPKAIQSDNGPPFASTTGLHGLTRLSAWWMALGIRVVRSRVGCPQDNGGHERMHRDMAQELERFPAWTKREQQEHCWRWREEFNHHRPHEALGGATPASVYRKSTKVFPSGTPVLTYPAFLQPRVVSSCGTVRYQCFQRHLSGALAGQTVAFEPLPDGAFQVWYADVCLGKGYLPWTAPLVPVSSDFELSSRDQPPSGVTQIA